MSRKAIIVGLPLEAGRDSSGQDGALYCRFEELEKAGSLSGIAMMRLLGGVSLRMLDMKYLKSQTQILFSPLRIDFNSCPREPELYSHITIYHQVKKRERKRMDQHKWGNI